MNVLFVKQDPHQGRVIAAHVAEDQTYGGWSARLSRKTFDALVVDLFKADTETETTASGN